MNKARRKELDKALELLHEVERIVSEVRDEEQEAFDNMPESLQTGERGEMMEAAISALEYAEGPLDELRGHIEEAQE